MAELTTLARPYADAAFQYASEAGQMESWDKALRFLAAVVRDQEAQVLLSNPEIDKGAKLGFLRDLAKDLLNPQMQNFLALLLENDRLELMPEIQALFEARKRGLEGQIEAVVSSAVALNESQLGNVKSALKRRFGREVILETRVEPDLIGGMIIRAGDLVIDGSVRGQLEQLGNTLRS
ncbi:MAG: F0F1 ATP synthase subunit delta [Pseudomonadota bacterium]|uniref:F0F1 ATP synthase subunit delta n=1 Tax=Thermithiobacillus tepidarius TaxID=929 RepID=UPI0004149629|nr:F0F1 ATP synthase subunit delta [Thermithiobacillus tepidarius]